MALLSRNNLFSLLLIAAGLLYSVPAQGESIIGTVVSQNLDQFILREKMMKENTSPIRTIKVVYRPCHNTTPPGHIFPRCVHTGKTILINGEFNEKKKSPMLT